MQLILQQQHPSSRPTSGRVGGWWLLRGHHFPAGLAVGPLLTPLVLPRPGSNHWSMQRAALGQHRSLVLAPNGVGGAGRRDARCPQVGALQQNRAGCSTGGDTGDMGCPHAWLGAASVPVLPAEAARSTTTCQGFASSSLFLAAVNALRAETILPHVFVLINSENTD